MRKRKRKLDPPALEVAGRERAVVVTAKRAVWKETHTKFHEKTIRLVRFVWMRQGLTFEDRHKLHAHWLGTALRAGLVQYQDGYLITTVRGRSLLEEDRK